jgi:hypothetical protein
MAKVKVKRKKISPQRKKAQDYESPYAEYLLNAIKDNPTSETKVSLFVQITLIVISKSAWSRCNESKLEP